MPSSSTSTSDGRILFTHKKGLAPSYAGGSFSLTKESDEKEYDSAASSNDPYPDLYERNPYPREINTISENQAVVMRRRANEDTLASSSKWRIFNMDLSLNTNPSLM